MNLKKSSTDVYGITIYYQNNVCELMDQALCMVLGFGFNLILPPLHFLV